ncbi:CLOCK-interacting pacemaker [Salmo salar]|uniref:CLOCK-interacting pacemaker n=1 Tax=Salmo salar TaxID=8030 RepID=A0A1S3SA91_SALSA|nr:CLOCK-interacting pacemaker-like [Salmo salar]|eukprot:XP_014061268.1 PREDICTED: CLOCK-interacting pacemaker-like [Salmo salar]
MSSTKRKAEGHSRNMGKLRTMKSGSSRTDSERDSGFSDASTIDPTDSEGSSHSVSKREVQRPGSVLGAQSSQLAVVGGSYSNMPPMIIQQPQVVFLQPVVSHCTTSNPKEASSKHRRPKKFLPILRSYPKIAPHPGDSSSSSGRGSSCSSSSGSERGGLSSSHRERHHNHRDKQQKQQSGSSISGSSGSSTLSLPPPTSSLSPSPQRRLALTLSLTDSSACSSPARPSPAVSRSEYNLATSLTVTPSHTLNFEHPEKLKSQPLSLPKHAGTTDNGDGDDHDIKRKRFCNTYNILSKSGLLDITLRTKDLLRQNRRTQGDLDRLKEHTNLFLQALQTGDTSIWSKLQTSLQEEEKETVEKGRGSGQQSILKADTD